MALFKRNKDTTTADQAYYPQRRVGMAWLLGIATLVLTVLLALGFFYGGRWAYRTVFDNDDSNTASENQDRETEELDGLSIDGGGDSNTTGDDEAASTDETDDNVEILGSDTNEQDNEAAGESRSSQTSQNSSESIPSSGASELPSTGPSGPEELQ